MNKGITLIRPKYFLAPGFKHIYLCLKVGHFNTRVKKDGLNFDASIKWPFEELHFFGTSALSLLSANNDF